MFGRFCNPVILQLHDVVPLQFPLPPLLFDQLTDVTPEDAVPDKVIELPFAP
jgi:hypothetical protein